MTDAPQWVRDGFETPEEWEQWVATNKKLEEEDEKKKLELSPYMTPQAPPNTPRGMTIFGVQTTRENMQRQMEIAFNKWVQSEYAKHFKDQAEENPMACLDEVLKTAVQKRKDKKAEKEDGDGRSEGRYLLVTVNAKPECSWTELMDGLVYMVSSYQEYTQHLVTLRAVLEHRWVYDPKANTKIVPDEPPGPHLHILIKRSLGDDRTKPSVLKKHFEKAFNHCCDVKNNHCLNIKIDKADTGLGFERYIQGQKTTDEKAYRVEMDRLFRAQQDIPDIMDADYLTSCSV